MEIREGYKQTEVGVIPEDWKICSYDTYMDVFSGKGFSRSEYTQSGIKLLRIDNVSYGKVIWDSIAYLPEDYQFQYPKLYLEKDDILIALNRPITNNQLKIAKLTNTDLPSILYQRVGKLVINKNYINNNFAFYILSVFIKDFVEKTSVGSDQPFISTNKLKKMFVPIPPLPEQQAIATVLSDINGLINSLQKLIDKKKNIKQGTMQELLTGKRRLEGFSGEWEERYLGDIAEVTMGQSPDSRFYNTNNVGIPLVQGNADIDNRKTIIRNYTLQKTKQAKKGDIIMTVRAPVGYIGKASYDCCIGRGVCAISCKNDYLYHYLVFIENTWSTLSKGSTFDSVNSKEVNELVIMVPQTKEEQTAIANILSDMDSEIESLGRKLDKYRNIKQGMMQELLTGRIRLLEEVVQ